MTKEEIKRTKWYLENNPLGFYSWRKWRRLAEEVKKKDHYECQLCKQRGKLTIKGLQVHHVHHLKDRPDLALEKYDENGNRNLITLCRSCHDEVHPEKHKAFKAKEGYTNEERW